jgi:hypothetical protein
MMIRTARVQGHCVDFDGWCHTVPSPLAGEGQGGGWPHARCLLLPPSPPLPRKGGGSRPSLPHSLDYTRELGGSA